MQKAKMMVANRDYTLRTVHGNCRFEKDKPRLVSPFLVGAALAVGILPVDDETPVPSGGAEETTQPEVKTPEERNEDIQAALATMEGRAGTPEGRDDWTAARRPKVDVVSQLVGYKVHSREINRIIDERNAAENEAKLEAKKAKRAEPKVKEPEGGEDYGE